MLISQLKQHSVCNALCYILPVIVIQQLLWDESNIAHIARHDVSPQEVEEVCHSDYLALADHTERILPLGLAIAGRILVVVLDPEVDSACSGPGILDNPVSGYDDVTGSDSCVAKDRGCTLLLGNA